MQIFGLLLFLPGLGFKLNISEKNLVLELRLIALVIALPYFHSLRYYSLKDGENGSSKPAKSLVQTDFDRVLKVHFILLDWFV